MLGIDAILQGIFQRDWSSAGIIDIIEILLNVIKLLLILGNVTAVALIVWNAYGYITAFGGGEEKAKKAKQGITYAITGVVIITLSFFIVNFVYGVLSNKVPEEISNPNKTLKIK